MERSYKNKLEPNNLQSLSGNKNQHHHQLPCLNLHRKLGKPTSVEDMFLSFQALKPAQSFPIPLVAANDISNKVLNGIETCNSLVLEKVNLLKSQQKILVNACRAYKRNKTSMLRIDALEEQLLSECRVVEIPKEVYRLARAIERDPDPHFTGHENWYYSNNIVAKHILNTPCILAARGRYTNDVGVIPLCTLNEADPQWSAEEDHLHHCSLDSLQPVLQLVATRKGFIGVRKKSTISILKLKGLQEHAPSTTLALTLRAICYPFTSMDIHKHEVLVTDTARHLRVYHVRNNVPKLEGIVRTDPGCTYSNNWNSVAYSRGNPGVAMFADVCGVSVIDISSAAFNVIDFWCTKPFLESCERVCVLRQSEANLDVWYLATTHHLFGLNVKRSGPAAFLFRIVHQMSACPLHCVVKCVDNQEVVVLGDQACNQLRSFRVQWNVNGVPSVWSYASYVNTPLDTLREARTRGEVLSSRLTRRFDNNLLGLTFLPSPSESSDPKSFHAHRSLTLFSLRSSGDVFSQDMSQEPLVEQANSPDELSVDGDRSSDSGINSPVNVNASTAEFANARRQELNESMDMFSSQPDEDGVSAPPTSETATPDLFLASQKSHVKENHSLNKDNRSLSEDIRSLSEDIRSLSRNINSRELSVLQKWVAQFETRDVPRMKPMMGALTSRFHDLFSDTPILPESRAQEPDQTLNCILSDLKLSGIDLNILKCKDPIFDSITTWSDDSTDDERVPSTNRYFESVNRMDPSDSNWSDAESLEDNVRENVDADTFNDLFVMSDSDESAGATSSIRKAFTFDSEDDPDDCDPPPRTTSRKKNTVKANSCQKKTPNSTRSTTRSLTSSKKSARKK